MGTEFSTSSSYPLASFAPNYDGRLLVMLGSELVVAAVMIVAYALADLSTIRRSCSEGTSLTQLSFPKGFTSSVCAIANDTAALRGVLNKLIRLQTFHGATGYVQLNAQGDRVASYQVRSVTLLWLSFALVQVLNQVAASDYAKAQLQQNLVSVGVCLEPGFAVMLCVSHCHQQNDSDPTSCGLARQGNASPR